jgi:hypothetical protein
MRHRIALSVARSNQSSNVNEQPSANHLRKTTSLGMVRTSYQLHGVPELLVCACDLLAEWIPGELLQLVCTAAGNES